VVFIPDAGRCYVAVVKTVVGKAKRLGNGAGPWKIQISVLKRLS